MQMRIDPFFFEIKTTGNDQGPVAGSIYLLAFNSLILCNATFRSAREYRYGL